MRSAERLEQGVRRLRLGTARRLVGLAEHVTPAPARDDLRSTVGGHWDEIGRLQFEYLVSEGLEPRHAFLDLGCGVLRGGLHFVRYLDRGNYYGIDISPQMIEGAGRELVDANLADRDAHLRVTDTFDADFGRRFDFAIAQSVFTHVPLNSIHRALGAVARSMDEGGRFYATFFRGPSGSDRFEPVAQPAHSGYEPIVTTADADPFHYSPADFVALCADLPFAVDDVGDWNHPRGQQMLRFRRTS
jgi:SAM-dependent methyltransferase